MLLTRCYVTRPQISLRLSSHTLAMLGLTQHWRLFVSAFASLVLTRGLAAQTNALNGDSLRLRYMRIRAQPTDSCKVVVRTSTPMLIQTEITPANVHRWIDSATTYAAAKPYRARGKEIRYAWIPMTLGISRTITDRHDAFEFVIGGATAFRSCVLAPV